jgi:hypothetical protein
MRSRAQFADPKGVTGELIVFSEESKATLTASSKSCKGSNAAIMPSGFFSVKYNREASSNPSCHSSCHKMATLINSRLTIRACSLVRKTLIQERSQLTWLTIVGLCSFMRSIMLVAAFFLAALEDLEATVKGYMSACGWNFPTSVRRLLILRRMLGCGV